MTKTKKFDCVEMKRRGALRIHERLSKMSLEEQVEYWRGRAEEFRRASGSEGDEPRGRPTDSR